jgi:FKBP-type peptidyl-prolyl cis-trans isomerase 2
MAAGSALLKALAFVLFLGALVGASWGVSAVLGDKTGQKVLAIAPLHPTLNATAGHNVTFPIRIDNRGGGDPAVRASLEAFGGTFRSPLVNAPAGGNRTVFVTLLVPEGTAPGAYPLNVSLLDEQGAVLRTRPDALTLGVLPPGAGFSNGQHANLTYTFRLADTGSVYESNDRALAGASFQKDASFAGVSAAPYVAPRSDTFLGLYEGLLGAQPGESRTITFGPDRGAGNATQETAEPRVLTLERNQTLPLPGTTLAEAQFQQFLEGSNQGNASDYKAGDVIHTQSPNGDPVPYRILAINQTEVRLVRDVHVNETYTLFPYFPSASRVVATNDSSVTFYTTPDVHVGDNLTVNDYWPQMSQVVSLNDTTIVIQHNPRVGLQFPKQTQDPTQPTITFTVKALTDEQVVESTPNPDPLGGRPLTVDFTVLSIS